MKKKARKVAKEYISAPPSGKGISVSSYIY